MEILVDSLKGRKANPSLQESIRTINRFIDIPKPPKITLDIFFLKNAQGGDKKFTSK